MKQFEVGKQYATRSAGDHNCIFAFTIVARTEKTVTICQDGKTVRRGISIYDGCEQFLPFGRYSMAPVVGADDLQPEAR